MAIPSGSGTEVLKVGLHTDMSTSQVKILDGVANHIYTVLSVVICETANAAEEFDLRYSSDGGSNAIYLLKNQSLAARKTFVFNDRLVLSGTHELLINSAGGANLDCVISYIDQDWT